MSNVEYTTLIEDLNEWLLDFGCLNGFDDIKTDEDGRYIISEDEGGFRKVRLPFAYQELDLKQ